MKILFSTLAKLFGRNLALTPAPVIIDQMNESRPLPTGMGEFEEWSDRIITGTLLPADPESQKFALATMLMHLAPTSDHECDGYFIKSLRKSAINQIAHAKMTEIRNRAKARLAEEELKKNENLTQAILSDTTGAVGTGDADSETASTEQVPQASQH